MATAKVEETINADSKAVWELLSDFGGVMRYAKNLTSCDLEGSGVGAVRTIKMGDFVIRERLEELDEAAQRYRYAIIEAPIPASDYLATVQISDTGDGKTKIEWSSTFDPGETPEGQLRELFEGIYRDSIKAATAVLGD
jgi:hypothetical protein